MTWGRRYQLLIAAAVILLDRVSKLLVVRRMPVAYDISIIPGLFQLSHWENTGAAFSMFADSSSPWRTGGLIVFSAVAIVVVSILLLRSGAAMNVTTSALAMILGGAIGNLWDRMAKGTVTDFLDFYIGQHHWPPFIISDSGIVIGSVLLLFHIMFGPKQHRTAR